MEHAPSPMAGEELGEVYLPPGNCNSSKARALISTDGLFWLGCISSYFLILSVTISYLLWLQRGPPKLHPFLLILSQLCKESNYFSILV